LGKNVKHFLLIRQQGLSYTVTVLTTSYRIAGGVNINFK